MRIVEFEGQTGLLGAPEHWNQKGGIECGYLPYVSEVVGGYRAVSSYWKPTPEELAELNAGGYVRLTVIGLTHPVVAIGTGQVTELP